MISSFSFVVVSLKQILTTIPVKPEILNAPERVGLHAIMTSVSYQFFYCFLLVIKILVIGSGDVVLNYIHAGKTFIFIK